MQVTLRCGAGVGGFGRGVSGHRCYIQGGRRNILARAINPVAGVDLTRVSRSGAPRHNTAGHTVAVVPLPSLARPARKLARLLRPRR